MMRLFLLRILKSSKTVNAHFSFPLHIPVFSYRNLTLEKCITCDMRAKSIDSLIYLFISCQPYTHVCAYEKKYPK